jgi:hypothetical protein
LEQTIAPIFKGQEILRRKLVHNLPFCKFTGLTPHKNTHLDPSMKGSTKDFRQPKHAIKPYCMMFKQMKEKKEAAINHNVSAKKGKILNK